MEGWALGAGVGMGARYLQGVQAPGPSCCYPPVRRTQASGFPAAVGRDEGHQGGVPQPGWGWEPGRLGSLVPCWGPVLPPSPAWVGGIPRERAPDARVPGSPLPARPGGCGGAGSALAPPQLLPPPPPPPAGSGAGGPGAGAGAADARGGGAGTGVGGAMGEGRQEEALPLPPRYRFRDLLLGEWQLDERYRGVGW